MKRCDEAMTVMTSPFCAMTEGSDDAGFGVGDFVDDFGVGDFAVDGHEGGVLALEIGRASCRERV